MVVKHSFGFSTICVIAVLAVVETNGQAFVLKPFYNSELLTSDPEYINGEIVRVNSESLNNTDLDSTTKKPLAEVPKATMDIITVIWYLSTFLALTAFFLLMACSDRRCRRSRIDNEEAQVAPPTPAPSYSEFAPPSYEAVMKQYHQVYVVPVSVIVPEKKSPDVTFHTVNELQKIG